MSPATTSIIRPDQGTCPCIATRPAQIHRSLIPTISQESEPVVSFYAGTPYGPLRRSQRGRILEPVCWSPCTRYPTWRPLRASWYRDAAGAAGSAISLRSPSPKGIDSDSIHLKTRVIGFTSPGTLQTRYSGVIFEFLIFLTKASIVYSTQSTSIWQTSQQPATPSWTSQT